MLKIGVSGDCDFVQMDDGWLAISTADCSHKNGRTVIKTNCKQRNPVYVLDVRIRKRNRDRWNTGHAPLSPLGLTIFVQGPQNSHI